MAPCGGQTSPSKSASDGIPCGVVIQRNLLDDLANRLAMPLATAGSKCKVPTALHPVIAAHGLRLQALAHYAAPMPAKLLRRPVDNLAALARALVATLDAVLSDVQHATVGFGGNAVTEIRFITAPYCLHKLPVLFGSVAPSARRTNWR